MNATIKLAIPKGRMNESIVALLRDAGIRLTTSARGYRPTISLPDYETKILKPQNIVEMLHAGSRDIGFAGSDWAAELQADVVEVLDTGLEPVRIVAAAPREMLIDGALPDRPLRVASELERLTQDWISTRNLDARFIRSYGATEVLPPEDADCIVDVAASGATLEANGLVITDTLMRSSTRLFASHEAWNDPTRRAAIDDFALLLTSVLEARNRVMLELNVVQDSLATVVDGLPCMRQPTIAPLHGNGACAVKAAVPRDMLPRLIPDLRARGATDIVISPIAQVVP